MKKKKSRLLKHAHSYLKLLIGKKDKKGIDVFKECLAVDKTFQPEPFTLFGIADLMNGAGLVKDSLKIYSLFIKRYPDDKLVAESYFKSAQIYNDRLFKTEKAIQILNYIQKKYPDSDIIPKTRNYLKTI
jgi:tetratricopeptide (TPR) repeat protein